MRKNDFYEMQIHKSEFTPLSFDDSFRIEVVDTLTTKSEIHFKNIISSIDERLSDWDDRPTIEDIEKRLDGVSKSTLFFHENFNEVIGWGWFSNVFTYDWINEVHPLPTKNSIYWGGTYIRKDLKIPRTTGVQMYNYGFRMFLSEHDYMYGYMDSWNKAPIKICHKIGGRQFNFIKNYKR
tara:strand:+ start:474 stop:1013 length:540 start_codon:yes stop_codon:yes gene_type:complete